MIADHIPGLLEVANGLRVSRYLIKVGDRVHTGIQFREKHHDAVELGHKYKFKVNNVTEYRARGWL